MSRYIDEHRGSFVIEPICQVLAVAPSSYYAGRSRSSSARTLRDAELKLEISRVHAANFGVYGVRKLWRGLIGEGVPIGRDRVGRLMAALGLGGVTRARTIRTTHPTPLVQRPADLVERIFTAPAPDHLWVADIVRHEALSTVHSLWSRTQVVPKLTRPSCRWSWSAEMPGLSEVMR